MPNELTCCGQPVAKSMSSKTKVYTIHCAKCGRMGAGLTAQEAEAQFQNREGTSLLAPTSVSTLPAYMAARMNELASIAVPFVGRDRPALTRLVKNNIRYVMTRDDKKFQDCWQTAEGQESIVHALEEALSLGAELGKMGSLVPFGGVVEFIPAVEAFEFALTNGGMPPFRWIVIDLIHEHDVRDIQRVNGEFTCKVKPGIPRGELIAVAVYGHNNRLGQVIGEVYDKERLLGKAMAHSSSYKGYWRNRTGFEKARTEGRVSTDNEGREYAEVRISDGTDGKYHEQDVENFKKAEEAKTLKGSGKRQYAEVELPKKGGGTWTKKIYRSDIENPGTKTKRVYKDEITNPYEGADQPEMLRKAAGKSFLGKYARVRNAEAALQESAGDDVETVVDATIDAAFSAFDSAPDEPTAPVDVTPEPTAEKPTQDTLGAFVAAVDEIDDELKSMSQEELDKAMAAEVAEDDADPNSLTGQFKKKVEANKGKDGDDQDDLF